MALEVLLRLRPRKYKYNAYSITSVDVLSRSISLIEYERMFAAIALSQVNTTQNWADINKQKIKGKLVKVWKAKESEIEIL